MDLEKWKQFLDSMNIIYREIKNKVNGNIHIQIDENHIEQSFSNSIDIVFEDGKFIKFISYGE